MGKILATRQVGDPILSIICEEVDINNINAEILDNISDLKETLNFSDGYGIAAPQVGINKRIIIIKVDKEKCKYTQCEDVPTTVMINPSWSPISDIKYIEYEGCLSIPSIRGKVERYKEIKVTYYDELGNKIIKEVKGFTARDIQHECDHLDGIVFLEKVTGPNGFATKDMIEKFKLKEKIENSMN